MAVFGTCRRLNAADPDRWLQVTELRAGSLETVPQLLEDRASKGIGD